MLTEDEIYGHATGMLNAAGGIYATSVIDFARAIESAVRAEYADVPPEKWKALYLVACDVRKNVMKWAKVRTANHLADATFDIDNGTYNPKIGGEE